MIWLFMLMAPAFTALAVRSGVEDRRDRALLDQAHDAHARGELDAIGHDELRERLGFH